MKDLKEKIKDFCKKLFLYILEKFFSFKISAKINLSFASIIIIFVLILAINLFTISRIPKTKDILINYYNAINIVKDMGKALSTENDLHNSVLTVGKMNDSSASYAKADNDFNAADKELHKLDNVLMPEELKSFKQLEQLHTSLFSLFFESTLKVGESITNGEASNIELDQKRIDTLKSLNDIEKNIQATLMSLTNSFQNNIDKYNSQINSQILITIVIFILAIVLAVFFSILFSLLLSRSILKNVNLLSTKIKHVIEKKDLSQLVEVYGKDEIAGLCSDLNKMIEWQRDVLVNFSDAANLIDSKSQLITATTGELSNVAQKQANFIGDFTTTIEQMDVGIQDVTQNILNIASNISNVSENTVEMSSATQETARNVESSVSYINQVTTAIGQMNSSIEVISKRSKEAQSEAMTTVSKANDGNVTVNNTINEMDEISHSVSNLSGAIRQLGESANEIGEIVNVIDDIAAQTNLLSLNAAIEAARAGEAGKGFAVVAGAIGELASRSGEATKDISKLIIGIQKEVGNAISITKDSIARVESGVKYVKSTGTSFNDIFTAVNKTNNFMQEIAESIAQQETKTKEIMSNVEKMTNIIHNLSTVTEQQAAGSDEVASSVREINNLMHQMSATTEEQAAGSQDVVKLIQNINAETLEVSNGSKEIAQSTTELMQLSKKLINLIGEFKLK